MALRLRRLPGIRTLLLATYLAVLLLPVAGIGILRLYESALIRQTEAELLAQAAVLSAAYRSAWLERAPPGALLAMPKSELPWSGSPSYGATDQWRPLLPQLDLAEATILPPAPDPTPAVREAEAIGRQIAPPLTAVTNDGADDAGRHRIIDPWGVIVSTADDVKLGRPCREEVNKPEGAPAARCGSGSWRRPTAGSRSAATPASASLSLCLRPTATCWAPCWCRARRATSCDFLQQALCAARRPSSGRRRRGARLFAGHTVVRLTRQLAAMARRVAGGEIHAVSRLRRR